MDTMGTTRIDLQKLQILNERLVLALDALNQVRWSAHATTFGYAGMPMPFPSYAPTFAPTYPTPYTPNFGYGFGTPGFGFPAPHFVNPWNTPVTGGWNTWSPTRTPMTYTATPGYANGHVAPVDGRFTPSFSPIAW